MALRRRVGRRQAGTAMVEASITLPLLLLILLGTVEFGLMFSRYQVILSSARAGARVASLWRETCNRRIVKAEVDSVIRANTSQLGILILPSSVQVNNACATNQPVTVTVSFDHHFTMLGDLLPSHVKVPLRATVQMLNEG